MKKAYLLFFFCIFISLPVSSQYFGGFSSSIEWRELETAHMRLIFPISMSSQAQQLANEIEYYISKEQIAHRVKLRKINIILNNQGVVSNGYVSSVPYHSMFFAQAPQDANMLGTHHWLSGLAVHEYRHVWQLNQMFSSWGKAFYFLWGDQGWAAFTSLVFPNWYFEGDAVFSETKYSNSGRARVPHFSLLSRALVLDSIVPSYKLVRNGSYKKNLPNHYEFGYQLLAYGEQRYGVEFWPNIVNKASRLSGCTYSFSKAIARYSGLSAVDFYDSMQVNYSKHTLQKMKLRTCSSSENICKQSTTVTNYYQSFYETDSTLLVLKNSFKDLLAVYRLNLNTKLEQKIVELGYLDSPHFAYAHDILLWSETKHDIRRWNTEYSIVKMKNLRTGKQKSISANSRYFSPSVHPTKNEAVVVSCTPNQQYSLHIISLENGRLLAVPDSMQFKQGELLSSPVYTEDGNALVFILKKNSRLALFEYDFETKQINQLTPYTTHTITRPVAKASKVYFSASFDGQDDIFSVHRKTKQLNRVLISRLGAYAPVILADSTVMVYSNFTSSGFNLQQATLSDSIEESFQFEDSIQANFYGASIFNKQDFVRDSVSRVLYPVKLYDKTKHALNIHSWGPASTSDDLSGLELSSNNVLNDLSVAAGLYYSSADKFSYTGFDISYGGLYSMLNLNYLYSNNSQYTLDVLEANLILPLDFSSPRYSKNLSLKAGLITQRYDLFTELYAFDGTQAEFAFSYYKYPARLQVAPRVGLDVSVSFKDGLLNDFYSIGESVFNTQLYLPGLFKTHAASFKYSTKTQDFDGFFQDGMSYARGFNRPDSVFANYKLYAVNYQLPICYPDAGINGFFFLKRIRLNLFADFAQASLFDAAKLQYSSYGFETYFDVNWFNLLEVPIFVRYVRLQKPSIGQVFEFGAKVVSL